MENLKKGTGGRRTYDEIKGRILNLEFEPGMELEETHLAKLLGVSRTPIREALVRLGAEGLVTLMPNLGARVAAMDIGDLRQFFEALDICQRTVTRLAARRRGETEIEAIEKPLLGFEKVAGGGDANAMIEQNHHFHETIGAAAHNHYLGQTYSRLLTEGLRIARVCFAHEVDPGDPLTGHLDRTIGDHRAMFEAIREHDEDAAEDIARLHCDLFRRRIAQNLTGIEANTAHGKSGLK